MSDGQEGRPPVATDAAGVDLLRQITEAIPEPILAVDRLGCIALANTAARARWRFDLADDAATHCHGLIFGRSAPCTGEGQPCPLAQVLEGRGPVQVVQVHPLADGREAIIEVSAAPVLDAAGGVSHVVLRYNDITRRRQAEEERRRFEERIQEARRMESLGLLAGGIAHDFNNLLTVIVGHADLARKALSEQSPAYNNVQRLKAAAMRASELTYQMLAYAGRGRYAAVRLSLNDLVRDAMEAVRRATAGAGRARLGLAAHLDPDLPPIEADVFQIRQVAMNLLDNAADAVAAHHGEIRVRTARVDLRPDAPGREFLLKADPGPYVMLEVSDNGGGIAPEIRPRIFEPFFTTKAVGRGLGLPAVLGIVRTHGGTLEVESEPGRGATFRALFPFAGTKAAEAQ